MNFSCKKIQLTLCNFVTVLGKVLTQVVSGLDITLIKKDRTDENVWVMARATQVPLIVSPFYNVSKMLSWESEMHQNNKSYHLSDYSGKKNP